MGRIRHDFGEFALQRSPVTVGECLARRLRSHRLIRRFVSNFLHTVQNELPSASVGLLIAPRLVKFAGSPDWIDS